MQITNEQVIAAARAGAELLASDDARVPAAQMNHLLLLREILVGVATGRLVIGVPQQQQQQQQQQPGGAEDKNQAGGRAGRGSRR